MDKKRKLLVVQVAALSQELNLDGLSLKRIKTVFPAVTCTVQASMRTATFPALHGMVGNFYMSRDLGKPLFWEQSAKLVCGERIWEKFRNKGNKVAMLFWQQSLGENVDILLSPAPLHKHHGGMIMDCYSKPAGLYKQLCNKIGSEFKLSKYWGPFASALVGEWITEATLRIVNESELSPELCFTYLPTLDYDLQRYDPQISTKAKRAHDILAAQLKRMISGAKNAGYEILIYGDYHITPVKGAVLPNKILLENDFMAVRKVKGMLYPDFYTSRAFAVTDHQVAHIYIRDKNDIQPVRFLLDKTTGIESIYTGSELNELKLNHFNSAELVALADKDKWFAYPWWQDQRQAPDYASHVDIHNKPGYDPAELFMGWPPWSVSQNPERIKGSHGHSGEGFEAVWGSTLAISEQPANLVELASEIKKYLDNN